MSSSGTAGWPGSWAPPSVDLAAVAGTFGDALHRAGLPVTPERAGRFAQALVLVRPATVDALYWTARATLVTDHGQLGVFDRVFGRIFGGLVDVAGSRGQADPSPGRATEPAPSWDSGEPPVRADAVAAALAGGVDEAGDSAGPGTTRVGLTSAEERLASKDFATLTEAELAVLRRMLRRLVVTPPVRRSRRTRRHPRGHDLDLRATLRRARRTGGDPVHRVRRRHRTRPRRLVLICDVSGSMAGYSRPYLQLLHAAVQATRAEVFVFATRLTRLTPSLRVRDPDAALRRAGTAAPDWSGGTRIGAALRAFNDGYGRRGVARGAVVVILSDGWECADPGLVGRETERLSRLAHRVIWVNPRKASPAYRPLVGALRAALPYCDAFVSGHSLDALDEVFAAVAGADSGSPIRPRSSVRDFA